MLRVSLLKVAKQIKSKEEHAVLIKGLDNDVQVGCGAEMMMT